MARAVTRAAVKSMEDILLLQLLLQRRRRRQRRFLDGT